MKPAADSLGPAGSTPGPEAGPPGLRVDSLERIVPRLMDTEDRAGAETLEIHLERYRFAADHARPGRLLDLACGVGYGTRLMADRQPAIESAWTNPTSSPGLKAMKPKVCRCMKRTVTRLPGSRSTTRR